MAPYRPCMWAPYGTHMAPYGVPMPHMGLCHSTREPHPHGSHLRQFPLTLPNLAGVSSEKKKEGRLSGGVSEALGVTSWKLILPQPHCQFRSYRDVQEAPFSTYRQNAAEGPGGLPPMSLSLPGRGLPPFIVVCTCLQHITDQSDDGTIH